MPFEIGTASGHIDLHNKIREFLIATPIGSQGYVGTGNGTMTDLWMLPNAVVEVWTITCITAAVDGGTFSVVGSVSGAQANATVGTRYDNGFISFLINDGSTDFIVNDAFTVTLVARAAAADLAAIAEEWVQHRWDGTEFILEGNGLSPDQIAKGPDQIYMGVRNLTNGISHWNLGIRGFTGFVSIDPFESQPGVSDESFTSLWDQTIDYWLVGNGRRWHCFAKVSTIYTGIGAGFFDVYGTPNQYPYPLYIGGAHSSSTRAFSSEDPNHRYFPIPGEFGLRFRFVDGAWHTIANWFNSGGNDSARTTNNVWPHRAGSNNTDDRWATVIAQIDGDYTLFPCVVNISSPSDAIIGEINGIYQVSGTGNASENTTTEGSDTIVFFQNIFRLNQDDFIGVRLA